MKKLAIALLVLMLAVDAEADALKKIFSPVGMLIAGSTVVLATGTYRQLCINPDGTLKEGCKRKTTTSNEESKSADDVGFLRTNNTKEIRRVLNIERQAAGLPPDPDECAAHHIVPQTEDRLWARNDARVAREVLESCEISIDDAANGVYLPNKKNAKGCDGAYHRKVHDKYYYSEVRRRIREAVENAGCDGVYQELRAIGRELAKGGIK